MTVHAQSDARDLLSALREAHVEYAIAERQSLTWTGTPRQLDQASNRRDAAAASVRELAAWLQAKLCADASELARVEDLLVDERTRIGAAIGRIDRGDMAGARLALFESPAAASADRVARLEAALRAYGRHSANCATPLIGGDCNCGLEALLAESERARRGSE